MTPPEIEPYIAPDGDIQQVANWNRWRGSVDTTLKQIPAQIDALSGAMADRLDALDRNLNRRLDKQDKEIAGIHTQTKLTNGTVIRHESDIVAVRGELDELVEAAELAAQEAAQGVHHAAVAKRQDRQFRLTTLIGACGTTAALVASIATVISLVFK